MRRLHALIAAAAVALVLTACGGSSHSSSTASGPALSTAAWKVKVSGICSSMTAQTNALPKPTKASELKSYIQKIINLSHSEIAQIKAVNPPAQFAAGQAAVIGDLTTVFGGLQALLSQPITATSFASELRSPKVLHAAQDYVARSKAAGLPSCVLANGA